MPMINEQGGPCDLINLIFWGWLSIKIAKGDQSLLCAENVADRYVIFTFRETHLFYR